MISSTLLIVKVIKINHVCLSIIFTINYYYFYCTAEPIFYIFSLRKDIICTNKFVAKQTIFICLIEPYMPRSKVG